MLNENYEGQSEAHFDCLCHVCATEAHEAEGVREQELAPAASEEENASAASDRQGTPDEVDSRVASLLDFVTAEIQKLENAPQVTSSSDASDSSEEATSEKSLDPTVSLQVNYGDEDEDLSRAQLRTECDHQRNPFPMRSARRKA